MALLDSIDSILALRRPPDAPKSIHYVFGPHTTAGQPSDVVKTFAEVRPPGWQGKINAGIEATSLPGGRTLLTLWCEETGWPEVEPLWNELKNELQRLGVLFNEDKTETTTITMHKIQEQHLALNCSVATLLGAVETYAARLTLSFALPPYEVTQKSEQSAVILVWPEPAWPDRKATRLNRNNPADRKKAGVATVQAGPAGGCKVILSYTDLTWPTIEKSWQMLETMLEQLDYIGDAPAAAEPQADPQPERPKVKPGRKRILNPDEARGACMVYHGLSKLNKSITLEDMADALTAALGLPEDRPLTYGTFKAYWDEYKNEKGGKL